MEVILSALISAVSAIAVSMIGNSAHFKKSITEKTKIDALQTYRIEQLEKQADKNETFTDRITVLEKDRDVASEKIAAVDKRVENLERDK